MNEKNRTKELPWFTATSGVFGENLPVNDFVHTEVPPEPYSISETYWFNFGDPKTGLVADFYTVMRRNLDIALTGVWIYRGMNREHPMLIEHYNVQTALPPHKLEGNVISAATFGLDFEIVEPMHRAAVRYAPASGDAAADLQFEALLPMVTTAHNDHYDQAMWCKGTLRLGNETIKVDAPGFRDRTWGVARPEEALKHPPLAYIWGVVDDGRSAFNLRIGDDPEKGAEWAGAYDLGSQQIFHGGWLQIKGELRAIVKASRTTKRDASNMMKPLEVRVDFEDSAGESHVLLGRTRSAMWFLPWGNIFAWFAYLEWSLDGKTGNGEVQDFTWPDYCRRFWNSTR